MKNKNKTTGIIVLWGLLFILFSTSCSDNKPEQKQGQPETTTESTIAQKDDTALETDPLKSSGIGPITALEVGPINEVLAKQGQTIFETKCAACHKMDTKYVGPALGDVTKRRTPEWIVNMILNPEEMTQKDPTAKQLLEEHLIQMTFQDISQEDAIAVLEYFRLYDEKSK